MIIVININLDSDDTGKIQLAVQQHIVPDWVYENSQVAHENKRVRLMLQHQEMLEREEKQEKQQKKQRVLRQQRVVEHTREVPNNSTSRSYNKVVDDGLEL